ncbi:MAG: Eukaryotic translation initiation factor 3 subunit H [Lichina confinis]|nr:MAG: Eukaryotic translation initiation factor 3 subunit H [Lichina confinis]
MKIIKHCSQAFPTTATGFILGLDVGSVLQITNAFPFPNIDLPTHDSHHDANAASNLAAAAPRAKANTVYQNDMIKNLREVNVDSNNVGWYTSAAMGNFVTANMVENQFFYQKELNERTVALVQDISRSLQGSLSLRAFRLSPSFMVQFKEGKFTTESLQKSAFSYKDTFIELPVTIHNSHLLTTLLHQLPSQPTTEEQPIPSSRSALAKEMDSLRAPLNPNFDSLDLSVDPFLEKTSDLLLDSIETHYTELNNHQYYQRQLGREQQKIATWQTKRKAENTARVAAKQAPLPEDEWTRLFKLPQEPSRLETLLNSRQVEQYSRQIDSFAGNISGKMFAVRGNLLPDDGSS